VDAVLSRTVMLVLLALTSAGPLLADEKEEAINADRALLAGEWRVVSVEANGNKNADLGLGRVTIVNRLDGTWSLLSSGNVIAEGTSTIDPTFTPKTIDFKTTKGNNAGQTAFGIYEMSGKIRKLCIAEQGRPRPADFSAAAGSGRMLVVFERVDATK
jgi:uncharacterized protein (TIGR03067 family)